MMSTGTKGARAWVIAGGTAAGLIILRRWPFPGDHPLLQLIDAHRPWLFEAIHYSYVALLFSTPCWALSLLASLAFIFLESPPGKRQASVGLPPYPDPAPEK